MSAQVVEDYVGMVRQICPRYGIEPIVTLTSLSERCFDSTVPILFSQSSDREPDQARRCFEELFQQGRALGLVPYRYAADAMHLAVDPDLVFWRAVGQIKAALDPDDLIAPGRYCPTGATSSDRVVDD
jgi:hypothetical protein